MYNPLNDTNMTARQILKEMFPNIPISGGKDMVDYDWRQFKTHLEETLSDIRCYDYEEDYYPPTWTDFIKWTYDCGFRIYRDKVTFWAKYRTIRDWIDCGTKTSEWIVYTV